MMAAQKVPGKVACSLPNCGKVYTQRLILRRHLTLHHLGFRRFKCNFCGRMFSQGRYLFEHLNIHTNSHPVKCDIPGCDKRFKQKSRLFYHKKNDHGIKKFRLPKAVDVLKIRQKEITKKSKGDVPQFIFNYQEQVMKCLATKF